jgi:DNA sulfur modification protein DndC
MTAVVVSWTDAHGTKCLQKFQWEVFTMPRAHNLSFWDHERSTLEEAIDLAAASLCHYFARYQHVVVAFSGGKDSTTVVTLLLTLIRQGCVPLPKTLTILYTDTRLELPPLQASAIALLKELEARGVQTQMVLPELDHRFFVYVFGRGVPPPSNTFRWCTNQIKVLPMERAVATMSVQQGFGEWVWDNRYQKERCRAYGEWVWDERLQKNLFQPYEKYLLLTGVRLGESAARDNRIMVACSKDGAECGQGYFQYSKMGLYDTLAPIETWRVCHVWDWLFFHAPEAGFDTQMVAEVYGGDEAEEVNARTGCIECNLASKDLALANLLKLPRWQYLSPLAQLKPLYATLKRPENRLRKSGTDRRSDGKLAANPMRLGPLTFDARQRGLAEVLRIQEEVNHVARMSGMPTVDLINAEEQQRIVELIKASTWPDRWTGEEVHGDVLLDEVVADGVVQPRLNFVPSTEEVS